jgi:hypothetical protein
LLNYLAVAHYDDAGAGLGNHAEGVRNEDDRQVAAAVEVLEQVEDTT